jgi:branched-chain amino acid aminotransferase
MSVSSLNIKVTPTSQSRISELDQNNLVFGKQYADHMLACYYENGEWNTPEIIPFGDLSLSPATSFMHYGQAIFEGIKAYRHPDGSIAVFRPEDNWKRMNVSAARLDMPEIPAEIFLDGIKELIKLDAAWVPEGENTSLYIRPFMLGMDEFIGVRSSLSYAFYIITSPAGAYYSKPVRIYVQDQYVRAVPGGIGFTKAAGNYGASMLPTRTVKEMGYDQVLWTDAFEHKYVQEIGTMNVFFIVDGVALTPNLDEGTILAGVTRDSIITLLKENGIEVQERPISIDELVEAQKSGKLQEAFGSGTAASMSFISDLTYQGETLYLPEINTWSISPKIKKQLDDIRYGRTPDTHGWIFRI